MITKIEKKSYGMKMKEKIKVKKIQSQFMLTYQTINSSYKTMITL